MKRVFVLLFVLALTGLIPIQNADALTKVAREMNFMTVYAGTSIPTGTYSGYPGEDFNIGANYYKFRGTDVYDNALYLGIDYGKLIGKKLSFSLGFRYINHQAQDTVGTQAMGIVYSPTPKLNQYDLGAEMLYRLKDLDEMFLTPFVGLSVYTGFTTLDWGGLENENRFTIALSAEFGAEFKIMEDPAKKNFMTLVAMNSYTFTASGNRPKYFHFGGALRYYFNN